jgi:hypothetical protein
VAARNDDRQGAEYEGVDALMAAITGEPLPEGALDDPELEAEHRAALADVALLREQLGLIGDALAEAAGRAEAVTPAGRPQAARPPSGAEGTARPAQETGTGARPAPPPAAPVRPAGPPWWRRPAVRTFTLGTLAAGAAATFVVGMGWLIAQGGAGASSDAGAGAAKEDHKGSADSDTSVTPQGAIACSRLIVEGTVSRVEPMPGTGQDRITLAVERYYKPEKGADEIVFPMAEDVDPRLRKGDHVLVGIPNDAASPDRWAVGKKDIAIERAWILEALPEAKGMKCG